MTFASSGRRPLLFSILAFAILSLAGGCTDAASKASSEERPRVLRIGWVPNEEDLERRVRFERLVAHLSRRLDMPVELIQTSGYSTAIEAMRARKLDVCSMGPFAYLIAHDKAGAEAIIAPGTLAGEVNSYRSILVVPRNSPLRSMDDVKAKASTLTLAWVDPASASGHLVPRAYLESIGIQPERDFKNTIFTLSHLASAMSVKAGNVDLAVVTQNTRQNLINKGRLAEEDLRIIWMSAPITNSVTSMRGDFSAAFKKEVQEAYLDFRTGDPESWAKFQKLFVDPSTIWVAAHDRDYDALRELARNVKHLDLLD